MLEKFFFFVKFSAAAGAAHKSFISAETAHKNFCRRGIPRRQKSFLLSDPCKERRVLRVADRLARQ